MEIQGDPKQDMKWQAQVWNHTYAFADSFALKCAIELGIFDAIHSNDNNDKDKEGKPITLSGLISVLPSTSINTQNLYRLVRYLIHMNLLKINVVKGDETFSLTELSKLLLRNHENSLVNWALAIIDETSTSTWHQLSSCCSSSNDEATAFERVHGRSVWALAGENQELNQLINDAMACDTSLVMPAFVQSCDKVFNGIKSLVDVGGGTGTAMSFVAKAFPHINCTVFDLPHVVAASPPHPGVDMIGGDMFEFVPPADAILLKFMLHNWQDPECVKILKKCKEAVPKYGGKVIIMDIVMDQDGSDDDITQARISLDIDMMVTSGGRERTAEEWRLLLDTAGFSGLEIIPILAVQSVIVAFP